MGNLKQKKKSSRKLNENKSNSKHALSVLRYKEGVRKEQKQVAKQMLAKSNSRGA
jgi:hypothetical protein